MEQKKKRTGNRIPLVAAGLLCLALLSSWLISGLLARYTTSTEGGDAARVATFVIDGSAEGNTGYVYIQPGSGEDANDIDEFTIEVTNNSEVAVRYRFSMDVEGNLPLELTPTDDSSNLEPSENNLEWHTKDAVQNGTTKYKFKTVWKNKNNDYRYSDGIESIKVTLTAEQED
jgi:hypothetical protein